MIIVASFPEFDLSLNSRIIAKTLLRELCPQFVDTTKFGGRIPNKILEFRDGETNPERRPVGIRLSQCVSLPLIISEVVFKPSDQSLNTIAGRMES